MPAFAQNKKGAIFDTTMAMASAKIAAQARDRDARAQSRLISSLQAENADLRDSLLEFQVRIQQLEAENTHFHAENTRLRQVIDEEAARVARVRQQLAADAQADQQFDLAFGQALRLAAQPDLVLHHMRQQQQQQQQQRLQNSVRIVEEPEDSDTTFVRLLTQTLDSL